MKTLIVVFGLLAASTAYAFCQMTTVIDPTTGMVKMCTQCCEAGTCTVVCN